MDFGKLVYEQKKQVKEQKRKNHAHKVKEVKYRLNIEKHDYDYKVKHAIDFLDKGHKVKITLMFRGREMLHKEFGFELVDKIIKDLAEYGTVEAPAKLAGRNISASLSPISKKNRKAQTDDG